MGGTPRGYELLKMLSAYKERIIYAYIMKEDVHEIIKVSREIKNFCNKQRIPSQICKKIKISELYRISQLRPDVAFVCSCRTIIPPQIYKRIPLGCITAHDSLLPKYRGFAPLNWAIINGEKFTGVTLFRIQDGPVDSGDIFGQRKVRIGPKETAIEVYPRITKAALHLYRDFLKALKKGKIIGRRQNESLATYTCKRTPKDGLIDWNRSAGEVFNLIRALSTPYPCAWTCYEGKEIRIENATLPTKQLKYIGNIPGRVASIFKDGVLVLCGKGQIIINAILTEAGKYVEANRIFNSIKMTLGK